jgi:hypothetical protein
MAFCCEMQEAVRIEFTKGILNSVAIGDIGLKKPMSGRFHNLSQRHPPTGIGQLVDRKHLVPRPDGVTHRGGTNEARASRHNESHSASPGDRFVHSENRENTLRREGSSFCTISG